MRTWEPVPKGKRWRTFALGWFDVADGAVRIVTLGRWASDFALQYAVRIVHKEIETRKATLS